MSEEFDFEVENGVATVTLNRPDKLNALTFGVYASLRDLVIGLPGRGDVKVLVITGRGRGFCSGGDVEEIIGELVTFPTTQLLEFTRMTGALVKALRECPLPVIAAVNGIAAGAGLGDRARRRLPPARPVGEFRLSVHARRPRGRRHGQRVPAARESSDWAAPPSC